MATADSIIIWDDDSPPSSPFCTEVNNASRTPSKSIQHTSTMPEVDIMSAFKQATPVAFVKAATESDKENTGPASPSANAYEETPRRPICQESDVMTATRPTPASTRGQMLPHSTCKRPASPATVTLSTAKKPSLSTRIIDSSPIRPRSSHDPAPDTISEDQTIDDTCFSTFSEAPDMTRFARLPNSPSKPLYQTHMDSSTTPRQKKGASASRTPSPTPRRTHATRDETTSLLIDFTQPISTPGGRTGLTSSRTESNLLSHLHNSRSPYKHQGSSHRQSAALMNLLDFELPPPPTPRSAPTVSAREVEALKSGFASQLGSVKARLSGKEAEVASLKKALEEAERRVGEAEEAARMERIKREDAEREKESWERRGEEVERVLGSVREEVMRVEGEREGLVGRVEESERRAEEAERRVQELLDAMGQGKGEGLAQDEVQRLVGLQLDARIEAVSRELHGVYKKKHETKVATLKKSYEARSEKRCADLQARVDELARLNDELKTDRNETFSGELRIGKEELQEKGDELQHLRAEAEHHQGKIDGMEMELQTLKTDHSRLLQELEMERVEKGELVAAVDEMLSLQATDSVPQAVVEDFRKSLSRPTGMRQAITGPNGESKLGRPSGLARGGLGKSKMMSNIERMGHVRGAP